MIKPDEITITHCIIHQVGNRTKGENYKLSNELTELDNDLSELLKHYFLKPFQNIAENYRFNHDIDMMMNEVFSLSANILEGQDFIEHSQNIAQHLYNQTRHPAVRSGELFVAVLEGIEIEGYRYKAVGLFKSEQKESFLKIRESKNSLGVAVENGVNIQKLDKGCIVVGTDYQDGFKVLTYENANADTEYWRNDFLGIQILNDSYTKTKNFLSLCKDYVAETLPENFNVSKADQIDYLNRSVEYFKNHETFNSADFATEVFQDPGIINDFKRFGEDRKDALLPLQQDGFDISAQAVKSTARYFKSILKLDKNFHVYIHGDRQMIERGFDDERGMNFYKLYFNKEQ